MSIRLWGDAPQQLGSARITLYANKHVRTFTSTMRIEFEPGRVALPDDLLTITELPDADTEIRSFLRTQQLGHIAAHTGIPCLGTADEQYRERHMTEAEAAAVFDPADDWQVAELHNIASGRYSMSTRRNQLLLQGKLIIDGREQAVACLNGIYGGWVCNVGGEAHALHALELHVRPDYQARRIGAAMVSVWLNTVTEPGQLAEMSLLVSPYNYKARNWYERLGLVRTGHTTCGLKERLGIQIELEERAGSVLAVREKLRSVYDFRLESL